MECFSSLLFSKTDHYAVCFLAPTRLPGRNTNSAVYRVRYVASPGLEAKVPIINVACPEFESILGSLEEIRTYIIIKLPLGTHRDFATA